MCKLLLDPTCLRVVVIVLIAVLRTGTATSAPITFFGEDLNSSPDPIAHPNADAAQALFLSNLTGGGAETFESFVPLTSAPLALAFPGAGTGTLTGFGEVFGGWTGAGRYPISGDQFWDAAGNVVIDFSNPIAAMGFYAVDLGDYGGMLLLRLTASDGGSLTLPVPNSISLSGSTDGSVVYFGFYDPSQTYTRVIFDDGPAPGDAFGLDDIMVAGLEQLTPIPEPTSMLLLATGLAAAGVRQLRRRRR